MARFSLAFAAAGVLLIVAIATFTEASTRTVFTTTTFEENSRGKSGTGSQCYQPIMEQQMLNHCGLYLLNVIGGKSQGSPSEDHKQKCCMQLKNVGQECMCPGIKMMMNQPMWSMMGQMMGEMMNVAQNLPTECKLMSEPCQMQAVWF